jgi:hypothetical protein
MQRYIVIYVLRDSPMFYIIPHKRHDFWGKVSEQKMGFNGPYKFAWNISHPKKNGATYYQKCT